MVTQTGILVRTCLGEVYFGERPGNYTGFSAEIRQESGRIILTAYGDKGEISPPAEVLCGAGKYLWDQGIRQFPTEVVLGRSGERRSLLCSVCADRVTAVTALVGTADFMPKNIPIRFEKSVINDTVTLPGLRPFSLTAVGFHRPYALVFLESAGDCAALDRGREIGNMSLFPGGAEVVFAYARGEKELHLRPWHGDGRGLGGDDCCAALAAAVATGRCLPDTSVSLPVKGGEVRGICRKDWNIFLTIPVGS